MKRPANALALAVLTLLYEKPMHPYEMSRDAAPPQQGGEHQAQLRLAVRRGRVAGKKGLVHAGETRREGNRPERTIYELTAAGEQAMHDWLGEMLRDPTPQFTDFEAALSLMGAIPPDVVEDLLRQRLEALTKRAPARGAARDAARRLPRDLHRRGRLRPAHARGRDRVRPGLVEKIAIEPARRPRGLAPAARAPRGGHAGEESSASSPRSSPASSTGSPDDAGG